LVTDGNGSHSPQADLRHLKAVARVLTGRAPSISEVAEREGFGTERPAHPAMEPPHSSTEKSVVHCRQTGTLTGAGSVLHVHNFEALRAKNLKCAIFIGVFVNHDCAVSRLFLAGMRGDTGPLKTTDTIRDVMSGPMAFTMEHPNFFHAASLPSIAMLISSSMNHSRSDTPAAMTGLPLSAFASPFESTKLLEAEDLVLPTENLILYAQRGLLKEPVSVPDLRFFCGR
jgi:hypothetical protein